MAVQARALATRQKFIDAAVDLFDQVGYSSTGLTDIADRAGVARGAFYYYFPTKESVAAAIFEQADAVVSEALIDVRCSSPSPLERLIRLTFVVADLTQHNRVVRMGNLLRQCLTQVSPVAPDTFDAQRRLELVRVTTKAVAVGELREDTDPDAFGHTILVGMLGARLLSDATGDDMTTRLRQVWATILRGNVTPQCAPHMQNLVADIAQQYSRAAR